MRAYTCGSQAACMPKKQHGEGAITVASWILVLGVVAWGYHRCDQGCEKRSSERQKEEAQEREDIQSKVCVPSEESIYNPLIHKTEGSSSVMIRPEIWDRMMLDKRRAFAFWSYYCVFNPEEEDFVFVVDAKTGKYLARFGPKLGYTPDP